MRASGGRGCLAASPAALRLAPARERTGSVQRNPPKQEDAPLSSLTPEGLSGDHRNLFVTNGLDRVEPRSLDRRIDAENQTDRNGDNESQKNGANGHDGGPSGKPCNELRHSEAEDNAQKTTGNRHHHGFNHKLTDGVPSPGAESAPKTELTG